MCGNVGIITNSKAGFYKNEVQAFIELLYVDALRGDDATGVCLVDKDNKVTVMKDNSESCDFLRWQDTIDLMKDAAFSGRVLLGHNRKKTVGQNREQDAHPFVIDDNAVFFHNGTLTTHKHLADVDVDSHALGIHLTPSGGDKEKLEEALERVNGAYACIWYDQKQGKVFLLRNKERPLYIAKLKNDAIAYASEAWMLYGALARNNMQIDSVDPIDVDTIYSIDINASPISITKEKLEPKKSVSSPVITTKVSGKTGVSKEFADDKEPSFRPGTISKNASKRIIKALTGSYQSVWVDDVFPAQTVGGHLGDHYLWATCDEYPNVLFKARVSGLTEDQVTHEVLGNLMHGNCSHGTYDSETGTVVMWIKDVKINKRSLPRITYDQAKTQMH